jgi:thioester reductase-like protein
MAAVLFTGFPGFLGTALLPRVLERSAGDTAVCLVQSRFAALAAERAERIAADHPACDGRITLIEGDITEPGLGLDDPDALTRRTVEVFHLAAAYDLSVRRDIGLRVNVDGTRHVLEFAAACAGLRRLQHMSTCYVSGRYAGVAGEGDLARGQVFNNSYEETKFLAEVEVRAAMHRGLPATVYRPAIVVGDSRTGETQKYDGPYHVIRLLLRQGRVAVVPVVGDPAMTRINVVPRDFVVDAVAHLSALPRAAGRVYQLADPRPLTVDELLEELARVTGRRIVRVAVPRRTAKTGLRVPGARRLLQLPPNLVDYMVHPTHYATDNATADLEGTGIRVPPLPTYLDRLVEFVREHPEIGSTAMV